MFTGLIEHLPRLRSRVPMDTDGGFTLTFENAAPILEDCHIGDSISCNGACLTVTEFDSDSFKVGLAPETLNRTNLGELKVGDHVQCERAVSSHTRMGGHFVQGHVDGTAKIVSKIPDGNSIRFLFQLPTAEFLASIVEKGYITIDGASLTIVSINDVERTFGIMLIAHSQEKLVLGHKQVGDRVNFEVDAIGKFVEKAVRGAMGGLESDKSLEAMVERVVLKVLREKKLVE